MISVLILTKNEERDLPGAPRLRRAWSMTYTSSTRTHRRGPQQIAPRAAGAQLHTRFDDYATHRNAAFALPLQTSLALPARRRRAPHSGALRRDAARGHKKPPRQHRRLPPAPSRLPLRPLVQAGARSRRTTSASFAPDRAKYTRAINEVLDVDGPIAHLLCPARPPTGASGGHRALDRQTQHLLHHGSRAHRPLARALGAIPPWRAALRYSLRLPSPAACTRRRCFYRHARAPTHQMALHGPPARRDPGRRTHASPILPCNPSTST